MMNTTMVALSSPSVSDRGVTLARLSLIVFGAGQSAAFIALPIVFRQLDLLEAAAGIVFGLASTVSIFTATLLGRKSDVLGRRTILATCLAAYGLATLLFGLALYHFVSAGAAIVLVVCSLLAIRMVAGGMGSGIFPASQGYLADIFEPRPRLKESGRLSAGMNFGLLSGALLISAFGALAWRVEMAVIVAGVLAGALALVVWTSFPEVARSERIVPRRITARDPRIRDAVVLCVAFYIVQALVQQMLGFLVQDRLALTGSGAGFWSGICFVAAVGGSMLSQAFLISRFAGRYVLPAVFAVAAAGLFFASRATSGVELAVCMAVIGAAFGFVFPTLMGIVSGRVEREEQGGAAGIMASMSTFGLAIGPIFGGVLYSIVGSFAYAVAAAAMVALAVAAFIRKAAPDED